MSFPEIRNYPPSHYIQEDGVKIVEPFSFPVRDFINENGFAAVAVDDKSNENQLDLPKDQLGIVFFDPQRRFLYESQYVGYFIGRIDFQNRKEIPELEDVDWILFVHGRLHLEKLGILAQKMQDKFSRKVGVYLENEIESDTVPHLDEDGWKKILVSRVNPRG